MLYSLLLIAVTGALIYWYKRWQRIAPAQRKIFLRKSLLWLFLLITLLLVVTGRAHWIMGLLAGLLALLGRVAQIAQYVPLFKRIFDNANNSEPPRTGMTKQQAAQLLGVELTASPEEIKQAHKRLMQKVHPDRGGSDALASQLNRAKDVLLND